MWNFRVVTFRIFFSQIIGKHIVPGRSQPVATHSAVVFFFVSSLPARRKSHNHITRLNIRIINHICTFHPAGNGAVHNNRTHQIAHIGRFTARFVNIHTHFTQICNQFACSVDDGRNHFTRNAVFIPSNGGRKQDIIRGTHANQIIHIHNQRILCNAFPHGQITRFTPIHIRQRRFCTCAVGVHNVAIFRIISQKIGYNFTKSLWIQAFVNIFNGVVHIFFGS